MHPVVTDSGRREFAYRRYDHRSCGDWRGYKAHIWEGGHRVPLIARWPRRISPGRVIDESVCLTDFMATCAGLTGCGLPDDAAEDSFDLTPILLDHPQRSENPSTPIRAAVVHHSGFGVFSIRRGRWKLVMDCIDSGGWPTPRGTGPRPGSPGQLYDLATDPAEQHNLWHERSDKVKELSDLLMRYQQDGRSAPTRRPA